MGLFTETNWATSSDVHRCTEDTFTEERIVLPSRTQIWIPLQISYDQVFIRLLCPLSIGEGIGQSSLVGIPNIYLFSQSFSQSVYLSGEYWEFPLPFLLKVFLFLGKEKLCIKKIIFFTRPAITQITLITPITFTTIVLFSCNLWNKEERCWSLR